VSEPFLGEIRMFSANFAPRGWALCNGQLLPINQNQALFAILGTTYGGDGRVNFALPDLRGRAPMHVGAGHVLGERGGETAHTLSIAEMPAHQHAVRAAPGSATDTAPGGNLVAPQRRNETFSNAPDALAGGGTVGPAGGSQPHENSQPSTVITYIIALQGIFPSPN
jgi:microcystin-dependent protein